MRHDRYSDFGGTTNPMFGLAWRPTEALKVRATYGTSFKAPSLFQLHVGGLYAIFDLNDAVGTTPTLLLGGGNDTLGPESSTSWTTGVDFTPAALEGFRASLTYYSTKYEDRIAHLLDHPLSFEALRNPQLFSPVITRNPSLAQLNAINDQVLALGREIQNFSGVPLSGVLAIADMRHHNIAETLQSGFDLDLSQSLVRGEDHFSIAANVAYIAKMEDALTPVLPLVSSRDLVRAPIALKGRTSFSWSRASMSAGLTVNYSDDYRNGQVSPQEKVSSATTLDVFGAYEFSAAAPLLDGLSIHLNVLNVFDEDPPFVFPFVGSGLTYDPANFNPLGRFAALQISKRW
jgi:iron complex outermembrane receptor protein